MTSAAFAVVVEEAIGPGVDFERDADGVLVGRHARRGGVWLGFDRAALTDSDDGWGRQVPILVALPASTHAGARLEVELQGGWDTPTGPVLLARLAGGDAPDIALARLAAAVVDGRWFDERSAEQVARAARRRYRERSAHLRIVGGRAWHPDGAPTPEAARFATPHSAAEYSLARLPPRFLRGLADLLDDAERVLYWVEKPQTGTSYVLDRLRGRLDRRAALLLLTDRQLLSLVDHARPDRYLSDWGVDVELLPVERLVGARIAGGVGSVHLTVETTAGAHSFTLPAELEPEAAVLRDLIDRFLPSSARYLPRRRYATEPIAFDPAAVAPFGQEGEAQDLYDAAVSDGEVLGFVVSPRRPGQRSMAALCLRHTTIELIGARGRRSVELSDVVTLSVTLSPLIGRIATQPGVALTLPAPLMDQGATFVRLVRCALTAFP